MASLFDGADVDEDANLRVNEAFATRFEHNKKREDLHRLRERNPALAAKLEAQAVSGIAAAEVSVSDEDDDTSSDEDEDPAEEINGEFLETLLKIRSRDGSIYQKDAVFFGGSGGLEGDGEGQPKVKKQKPIYLRQVIAEQALKEVGASAGEAEEQPATYVDEQSQLKQDFLRAAEEVDPEEAEDSIGGVMQRRRRGGAAVPAVNEELLEEVFGKANADEGDNFLKNYIARQAWDEDAEETRVPLHEKVAEQLAEDEDYLQRADHFEASYNFRFQEDDAAQIVTYPRELDGVVRKTDDRRKLARKRKAERAEAAAAQRLAEVKRLKNLKRGEVDERLAEIQRISGHQSRAALSKLLEADFDPEAYDAAMAAAFDAEYYQGEDEQGDVMDETLARELAEMEDYKEGTDALDLARQRVADAAVQGEEGAQAAADPQQAQQLQEEKARVQQLIDEYFKLDYESTVGGMPCRFRYKEVPAASYGLDVLEILGIDNKELNQVVSMKKLAPYREDAGLARPNYAKVRELKNKLHEEQAAQRRPKAGAKAGAKRKHASEAAVPAGKDDPASVPAKREKKQRKAVRGAADGAVKSSTMPAAQQVPAASAEVLPGPPSAGIQASDSQKDQAWQREKRLETFAPLTLRKSSISAVKRSKQKKEESEKAARQAVSEIAGVQLTKAQKKNLKRSLKRKGASA